MADVECMTLSCYACNVQFTREHKTRGTRSFCSRVCREATAVAEYKPRSKTLFSCLACSTDFESFIPRSKYCSDKCRHRDQATPMISVWCDNCHQYKSRRNRWTKDSYRYCGRACAFAHWALISSEVESIRRIGKQIRAKNRELVLAESKQPNYIVKMSDWAQKHGTKSCITCQVPFTSLPKQYLRVCSEDCKPPKKKQKRCTTEAAIASRRKWRKIGKMRKRAATVEVFDEIDVLRRDKWRCKICGINTPKSLRGTYEPNAPEVDHIIPISKGGAHAMWNCQCACRKCNGLKSDRPLGQLLLAV